MDYIGYTPFIVGDQLFDMTTSWYGISSYSSTWTYEEGQNCIYEGKLYRALKESTGNLPTNSEYFEEAKFNSSNTYYSSNVVEYNNEWYYCLTERFC